jgi:hypothetical protein
VKAKLPHAGKEREREREGWTDITKVIVPFYWYVALCGCDI